MEIGEISITWSMGNDPQENARETTSSLHVFAGENFSIVEDLCVALDERKMRISHQKIN
jgi:hypothetical protein